MASVSRAAALPAGANRAKEAEMGLFTHREPATAKAADPRHPHEYKAPVSTWRTGCDICGQPPDDPRHVVEVKPDEPEVGANFNWPS
jgi:hypothetical protein